ncbi:MULTISPECIES: 3-keto-5-aminohexanoate cleavage protein [unclassified Saccharopolyspora]|uniref:3-keto-5-aminohexanoate cleavage protein n=1 Tax=unclassified Saccharopolyspora TaxID=2646250 RepID=UPI001CD36E22|nr:MULTISPECIES: 3-keto-5-aminohexanoate cleavage protein [unclassified Saccharopolyspora]MCA1188931.1 3-keto-5-aminohexanoate cleavage protein [Saccharopolyspora sp. 6T]MCA1226762.1 3-keto-5-aminohexanoate cleavage protein [Saccharopolyspora sp. 6M]MCA1282029.1 3-keto-5-aminohexanoate cleavage protein [Saccharopolyspora sp. 7B]
MTRSPDPTGAVLAVAPARPGRDESGSDVVARFARTAADCARVGAAVLDLAPVPGVPLAEPVRAVRRAGLLARVAATPDATPAELLSCGADALCAPLDAPAEFLRELRAGVAERGAALHLLARGAAELALLRDVPEPAHVVVVFTGDGPGAVAAFASAMDQVPAGTARTAAGVGPAGLPVLLTALAGGAHVRIGRGDTPDYAPGTPARDDAQLVARAAGVAKIAQRPPLAPERAAELLGIKT